MVQLPPGYKIAFQTKKNNMLMNEMVPAGETVDNWTEMVAVQIFFGLKTTPEQFAQRLNNGWLSACPDSTATTVASAVENGYPALVWLLDCPRNPATGKPEMTWVKAVAGNDSFYVVQKAFRFAPSKDQVVGPSSSRPWRCATRASPTASARRRRTRCFRSVQKRPRCCAAAK